MVNRPSASPSLRTIIRWAFGHTASIDISSELSPGAACAAAAHPLNVGADDRHTLLLGGGDQRFNARNLFVIETPAAPIPLRLAPVTMMTVLYCLPARSFASASSFSM